MTDWIVRFIAGIFLTIYAIALSTLANWVFNGTGLRQVIGCVGLFVAVAASFILIALLSSLANEDVPHSDARYVDKLIEKYNKEK